MHIGLAVFIILLIPSMLKFIIDSIADVVEGAIDFVDNVLCDITDFILKFI